MKDGEAAAELRSAPAKVPVDWGMEAGHEGDGRELREVEKGGKEGVGSSVEDVKGELRVSDEEVRDESEEDGKEDVKSEEEIDEPPAKATRSKKKKR